MIKHDAQSFSLKISIANSPTPFWPNIMVWPGGHTSRFELCRPHFSPPIRLRKTPIVKHVKTIQNQSNLGQPRELSSKSQASTSLHNHVTRECLLLLCSFYSHQPMLKRSSHSLVFKISCVLNPKIRTRLSATVNVFVELTIQRQSR